MFVSTKRRAEAEIPLTGGEVTEGVVRVGLTVRRPLKPSTPAVHALLRHLESVGFDGAPRVLGVDGSGREILTYIDGTAAVRPLPGYAVTDETLATLARLLRRYHDAVATFVPPADARWEQGSTPDDAPEIIGHCDVTPENVIFRAGRPHALIDFDLARPTTRLFEVVTTLRHWAPIADPLDRDPRQRGLDIGHRLRLFSDAYGLTPRDRRNLLPTARLRFDRSYLAMRRKAESHGGSWAQLWANGAGQRIRRASAWLDAHEDVLRDHLV
ncbi:trifolitoxin immunity protein [Acrocarpospora corrugata]|uniref:Trifolitoxin immunity protein n=1 Tax=Acrocarpospora corrugata TaxID=35763 RepID=A0A5M3VU81_9ACTN|nr:aminoglycoside phosphotransferase family protein [Acrocarpospora corrugata]GER99778.1 trifolitoxin immunity protein [Acrocarpospora corrugata]